MYCSNCGKENSPGVSFCIYCGNALMAETKDVSDADSAARKNKKQVFITLGVLLAALAAVIVLSVTGVFGTKEAAPSNSAQPLEDVIASLFASTDSTDIAPSTTQREPLPEGSVNETDYYTDETGQLKDEPELLSGLKYFYSKTGVQPYVWLTHSMNGSSETPTLEQMQTFAETKYNELFTDDAHVLLVMFENDYAYMYWYTIGPKAKTVIDAEAGTILGEYIDKYYNDMDLSYEQYLSKVFTKTADSIMRVTVQ